MPFEDRHWKRNVGALARASRDAGALDDDGSPVHPFQGETQYEDSHNPVIVDVTGQPPPGLVPAGLL